MTDDSPFAFDEDEPRRADDAAAADDTEIQELCRLALIELDEGRADAARSLAASAIEVDAEHPYPLFVLGIVADTEGDLAAARYLSERALGLAQTNADLIQFRAQVLLRDGDPAEAIRILRYGVAMHPTDADLHAQHARTLLADNQLAEARAAALASMRLDSGNIGAREVLQATGPLERDRDDVLAALRQAAQMHPDDAYAHLELAAAELDAGHIRRAQRLLDRAARLAPGDRSVAVARRMLAEGYDRPLLRPVPRLLTWLGSFPGGFAGLAVSFVVACVPLLMAAQAEPGFIPLVAMILGAWGLVIAYLWSAPKVADQLVNRAAARAAGRDASEDLALVADAVSLNVLAGRLPHAARIAEDALARGVVQGERREAAVATLSRRTRGLAAAPGRWPLLSEIGIPVGVAMACAAAALSTTSATAVAWLVAGASALLLVGFWSARVRSGCAAAAAAIADAG